ncbi:MAG TPA: PAS domain S-box protein, partial [Thermoanaerobaculia bacterium]|nr:PAS domain S-box protein [Thermoanaerobaculia bacterium]
MSSASAFDASLTEEFLGALILVTPAGDVVSWNHGAEALCGFASGEALDRSLFDLIIAADRAAEAREHLRKALETGAAAFESEIRRRDGSGLFVTIALKTIAPPGAAGQDAGAPGDAGGLRVAVNLRDDSSLRVQRQSRMLEARFRGLLEAAPDAMVMVNRAGRIVLVNTQAERLFGAGRLDLLGIAVEELVPESFREHHPGHRAAYFVDPRQRPMGRDLELFARRRDGT